MAGREGKRACVSGNSMRSLRKRPNLRETQKEIFGEESRSDGGRESGLLLLVSLFGLDKLC